MSSENYPHLDLNKDIIFPKKSRKPPLPPKMDINQKFYDEQERKIQRITTDFKEDTKEYSKYFKPHLIFKIKLHEKPSDGFRKSLKSIGINTIISSNSLSYWIVFTDELEFKKMKKDIIKRIEKYKDKKYSDVKYGTYIDYIVSIEPIPAEDKFRESIKNKPLDNSKSEYLDVEIWRMEDNELDSFIQGFTEMVKEKGGDVKDKLKTESFCVLRIHANGKLMKEIAKIREIAYIDRPPQIKLERKLETDVKKLDIQKPATNDLPGILILDSGILKHPILENAIGGDIQISNSTTFKGDSSHHGTQVASIALYGDINEHIDKGYFQPKILLYSAKIMREVGNNAIFDDEVLLETQLKNAVEIIIKKYDKCKIINISFGNSDHKITNELAQFRLASLIDELANKYKEIIFCISTGNTNKYDDDVDIKKYPGYFIRDTDKIRIIDPGTSIHGITVGSIYRKDEKNTHFPSSFTRVGPGLLGMIKPDLVENGGGDTDDAGVITANPNWVGDVRLFTLDKGSSFSAPMVAHQLALLKSKFPNESRNLIQSLLISSARIPTSLPGGLEDIDGKTSKSLQKLLNIYGYGKPNLNNAIHSESKRVILKHSGSIQIDKSQLFTVKLPEEFITKPGKRSIEITMVFDPPTDSKRSYYMGVNMEYRLFKNSDIEYVKSQHEKIINEDSEVHDEIMGEDSEVHDENLRQIDMVPGLNLRSKGAHQKSIKRYSRKPKISSDKSLILMVTCKKRWLVDESYTQNYSIVMSIKHDAVNELYDQIKIKNQIRAKVRA